jgi:hypothetical protein
MSKPRFFNTTDAARVLKTSRQAVDNWISQGFVDPIHRGLRGRDSHLLDESALFALAVGRACRQRGMSLAASGAVMRFAAAAGLEKLKVEFAAGRRFLVVVGDAATAATADVLLTREDALGPLSPSIRKMIGPFVPVIAVDLGEGFAAFTGEVAQLVSEREERTAAGAKG